ncbi:acyl-CoA dehydrogenase [Pseudonocardiaceae bacterium YIM PH 21723]|nr:acyl-CoA dehydrogenase [Pseudonocardiaceae bacterium YIM PH 21723]
MGYGLVLLNKVSGLAILDRFGLRKPAERALHDATKVGFRTVAAASRTFTPAKGKGKPARLPSQKSNGLFDLSLDDEQQMIKDTVAEFAAEQLRPAAEEADASCTAPEKLLHTASELGVSLVGIPEDLGGAGTERSATTNVLIAEAMAHGDMGLAVACLAPSAVSTALTLWGDDQQQATYLPSFTGENVPSAALAVLEARPLFDAFSLQTKAKRVPGGGYQLTGVKSLVPRAASAELFVVAAELEGKPELFLVESSTQGVSVESEPSMGLRAASLGRLILEDVKVPATAKLGTGENYAECIRLSRIAWSALAVGTGQAVLDYVIPYVNERVAFGEPISNRQGVAFKVADIGIELDGMRLVTYRAASRAEQGKTFARETALARRLCADKGMQIGSDGVQLLGGHGFVKDHPVERWYRDLRAIAVMEGAVLI